MATTSPPDPGPLRASRASPARISHVVYRTRRYEQMVAWYEIVFNATVHSRSPALAFMTFDGEDHRFAIANLEVLMPGPADVDKRGMIGVDHVAYTYASLDELFDHYVQLKAQSVLPYWCIHHGKTVSMYYADPDGNQMEFQVEVFRSNEEFEEYRRSSPLIARNPIGVEFDPEVWLAQVRAGALLADFLVRRVHEPVSPLRGAFADAVAAPGSGSV